MVRIDRSTLGWLSFQLALVGMISAEITLQLNNTLSSIFTNTIVTRLIIWSVSTAITHLLTFNLRYAVQQINALLHGSEVAQNSRLAWPLTGLIRRLATQLRSKFDVTQVRGAAAQQLREAAAQAERNRLARDLHDSIKQQIFSINIYAATAEARLENDPKAALEAIERVQQSTSESLDEMDALLVQLRPIALDRLGLVEALRELCTATGYRTGATVSLDIADLPADDQFDVGAQETIYRIVQEALSNAARHARAQTITVALQVTLPQPNQPQLVLSIRDDGQGFDPTAIKPGMGMETLRSRADQLGGQLQIDSNTEGTAVVVSEIPLLAKTTTKQSSLLWYNAIAFVNIHTNNHLFGNAVWLAIAYFLLPYVGWRFETPHPWQLILLFSGFVALTSAMLFSTRRKLGKPDQRTDAMGIEHIRAHSKRLEAWLHVEVGLIAGTTVYGLSNLTAAPWRYAYPLSLLAFLVMGMCLIGGLRRWLTSCGIEYQLAQVSAENQRAEAFVRPIRQTVYSSLALSALIVASWIRIDPSPYNSVFGIETRQWGEWLSLCAAGIAVVIWLLQTVRLLNTLRFPQEAISITPQSESRDIK